MNGSYFTMVLPTGSFDFKISFFSTFDNIFLTLLVLAKNYSIFIFLKHYSGTNTKHSSFES